MDFRMNSDTEYKPGLVSVIVPVYKVEKYLSRCVDSITGQTYGELEIILVDDGSPDACPHMCDGYAAADPRVKVIHKQNEGLGYARNTGLEAVRGEYVTFVDSDDWIGERHIENLVREMQDKRADIVIGSHTVVTDGGERHAHPLRIEKKVYEGEALRRDILLSYVGADTGFLQDVVIDSSCWSNLYSSAVIMSNGIRFPSEKEAVAEDLFFNVSYLHHCNRAAVIEENGYFYFENTSSISRKYDTGRFERTLRFYDKLRALIVECSLAEAAGHRAERTFLLKIRAASRLVVISDMKRADKLAELGRIIGDGTVQAVLASYPAQTLIPAFRLLAVCMKKKNTLGVYYLIKFREGAKKRQLLKRALAKIGIGR